MEISFKIVKIIIISLIFVGLISLPVLGFNDDEDIKSSEQLVEQNENIENKEENNTNDLDKPEEETINAKETQEENTEAVNQEETAMKSTEDEQTQEITISQDLEENENEIVEDGVYVIKSSVDNNKVLNIDVATNNVNIWTNSNSILQQFELTYIETENCYAIKSVFNGKYLDVYGGYTSAGTNVQIWAPNGTEAQKWIIQKVGDKYFIISKCNGLYLDVYKGLALDGTNIQVWSQNGGTNQQFIFEKVSIAQAKTIEDGVYKIKLYSNSNKVLNVNPVSGNVLLWGNNNDANEQFEIEYIEGEGCYKIKSNVTGKYLDVYGGFTSAGTNVQMWSGNGNDCQKWIIQKIGDKYFIISKCNGLYLDIYGGFTSNGTNVQMWSYNGGTAQQFVFEQVQTVKAKTIENGNYKIELYSNRNKSIDVNANSNVLLWDTRNNANQQFAFEYIEGEGCYKIKSNVTGKYLDVYGGYTSNGTNVQMWKQNSSDAQKWIVQKVGDKYFIISKCNGLYLDVYGGFTANGTNVQIWSYNGGTAQQFYIEKDEQTETPAITEGLYKIHLASDYNKAIEVKYGSIKSGANIQVGESANATNQYFYIKYNDSGVFQIKALNSDKMLDVYGGYEKAGTNVEQYNSNNTKAQKWIIQKEGNYYAIISTCGNLYLDIYGGYTAVGTNIQIWYDNGTIGQRFIFEEITGDIPIISEGNYRIRTAVSKNMALDIYADSKANGANVQIFNSSNVLNQRFKFIYLGNDIYRIQNLSSGKVIEVQGGRNTSETNVCQGEWKNLDYQKWKVLNAGNGYYYIVSVSSGLYLDVYGGYSYDETNVQVYTGHGGISQKFAIDSVIFGIDISYYQGDIDFNLVNSSGKVDFIIARAGYGRNDWQKDTRFEEYYSEAKNRGIPVGSYLYSYASDVEGAYAEAYNVLTWLAGKSFDLPIFYDLEDAAQDGLDSNTLIQMVRAFGDTLKSCGYKVGVYANKYWLTNRMDVSQLPEDYSIWVAAYGKNTGLIPKEVYEYFGEHDIWQYSSSGYVEGISGDVDVNIAYKTHLT